MSEKPIIVIVLDGGVVQNVFVPGGSDTQAIIIDHDTEGSPPEDLTDGMFIANIHTQPHADLHEDVRAALRKHCAEFGPDFQI